MEFLARSFVDRTTTLPERQPKMAQHINENGFRSIKLPENAAKAIFKSKTCDHSLLDLKYNSVIVSEKIILEFCDEINITNSSSAFIGFYAAVGFPPENDNSPELATYGDIIRYSKPEYVSYFDDIPEVMHEFGNRFFLITIGEEEGFFFYDSTTDGVYDTDNFIGLKAGKGLPAPKWKTFYDFLESYYGDGAYS
jgi:hypothetical protein